MLTLSIFIVEKYYKKSELILDVFYSFLKQYHIDS